ncbi:hypothetical protein [Cyclobacterium amurskyense]|uniref:BioF2-like acetyltransferase domain-containing protein n=1 Tax=Cyclobacterium amurskyense TaxID=320787 RepID=A0A0H4PXB0_9BACT|nr:hypothetical protein [Cyclobacterium amurskyense]AKP53007.1 hypothetical protein CA2015_3630 [Cyclobacterium amurskyense]
MVSDNYEVKLYSPELIGDWKKVLHGATNATLMHDRDFLAYHPSGKFQDCSVILYKNSLPKAVFAAHKEGSVVYSHKGLSYGGLIHIPCSINQKLEQFKVLLKFYDSLGIESLEIKETPSIYELIKEESTAYIMHLAQAKIIQMELSLAINLPLRVTHKGRKANIKQAEFVGLQIIESCDPDLFWEELLLPNLANRYNKRPTHTKEEMGYIMKCFPNNIRQFNVYKDKNIIAGATVYLTSNCLHTQYLASNQQGRKLHALDFLIKYLSENFSDQRKLLDFGHSNENNGLSINKSLFRWKESFGAKPYVHKHFLVPTNAWHALDTVYTKPSN